MRRHAEQLERRAKREEQLIKHNMQARAEGGIERELAVNDRYMDAI